MAGNVVQTFAPYAMQLQQQSGIPASITLAQLVQESGWNLSTLATLYHNPFGVKWDVNSRYPYVTLNTTEWDKSQGKYVTVPAQFVNYPDYWSAFTDRARLFSSSNYSNLWGTTDYTQYANNLHTDGYATDPNYGSELINIIKSNGLHSYDVQAGTYGSFPDTPPMSSQGGAPVDLSTNAGNLSAGQTITKMVIYLGLGIVAVMVLFKIGGK